MFSAMSQTKSGDQKAGETDCAVKVNFGSAGGGIDLKTYEEVKKMINDKKLKFTEKNMGREGEKEICLPLHELKKKKKTEFIERLKKTASVGQYVSVSAS
jgi:hypothetical protein